MKKWSVSLSVAALVLGLGACSSPSGDSADGSGSSDGAAAQPKQGMHDGEWIAYGGDKASTKYSSLDQINKDNVGSLEVAWEWTSPDVALSEENRSLIPFLHEVTPIMVNGVMYASTSFSQVAAINPVTGENIWVFDTKSYEAGRPTNLGFVHRGVSYWADGDDERIFIGTGDMKLWSLDAKTGQPHPDFNGGEAVDLIATNRRAESINPKTIAVSSPPIICNGVVVVGSSIFDGPTLKEMPPGDVRAFDAKTGAEAWTFYNPPLGETHGSETWKDGSHEYTGNGNVWTTMSADEELGLVYLPFGTPTNDWYGGHRKGDNLHAETLVAVHAATGEEAWHFQTTHHGVWDYDLCAAPALLDVVVDGTPIKAIAQVSKQGFVYCFNRETGEPLWPIEERAVPQSTAEGEETSPTQPFPTKPAPYETQGSFEENLIDFTPELLAEAKEILAGYNHGPIFTPPMEGKATIYMPGWGGGANWMGAAADPETGILYIPSMSGPISLTLQRPDPARSNMTFLGANKGVNGPSGLPLFKPPYGRITAIDINTGEHVFQVPHGDGPRDHELLKDLDLPPLGNSTRGHPMLTKTMLFVFEAAMGRGASGGASPANLRCFDKATGELLYEGVIPTGPSGIAASPSGTPMTYAIDGKQYITIPTGGMRTPAKFITLALPDDAA
jgi:quinoprotein glucose dehydrogenase